MRKTALLAGLCLLGLGIANARAETTTRVSVNSDGTQWSLGSSSPSVSDDGRYVAFQASEFTISEYGYPEYSRWDVYIRDTVAGTTKLVSRGMGGAPANNFSRSPSISADGRYVAFASAASNLIPFDLNNAEDIFLYDARLETLTCVSMSMTGGPGNGSSSNPRISRSGRFVAFQSHANNLVAVDQNGKIDVFVRDLQTETTVQASVGVDGLPANSHSYFPAVSDDGRYVAFESYATNLIPGGTASPALQIYRWDRQKEITQLVSRSAANAPANDLCLRAAISADGKFVAFHSKASNLVSGDTNSRTDVFVRNMDAGLTTRASVGEDGAQALYDSASAAPSADGRYGAFYSYSANIVPGEAGSGWPALQIVVRDAVTGKNRRGSRAPDGAPGNQNSDLCGISPNGKFVAYASFASNLVPDDTNNAADIFRVGPLAPSGATGLEDVRDALRIGAGLRKATPADLGRLDTPGSAPGIDLRDALAIARRASGLAP